MKKAVKYDKILIFFFSGTGNAKRAAEWIARESATMGISSRFINITDNPDLRAEKIDNSTLIGFCYPTHGFNAAPAMIKFLLKLPRKLKCDAFVLNTRAGMKLWKIFTPGLSGLAQIFPAFILKTKGCRMVGFRPLDLPSNWISLHPALRGETVDAIFERCERIVESFIRKIISGRKVYRGLYDLPIDIPIMPIGIGYYFWGRYMLAKTFVAAHTCGGCGICEKSCPVKAIKMIRDRPYWTFNCESCMKCMNNCPTNSIHTAHGFTIILWWFILASVQGIVFSYIARSIIDLSEASWILKDIIYYSVMFPVSVTIVFVSYRVMHYLLGFKVINHLIVYTSLTKLKFWGRYKAPSG